jgi:hypothetical protein
MSRALGGDATNTKGGIIHLGPRTFLVTAPPASRNLSRPVSNDLAAVNRCQYGSGFFGASGNVVTSALVLVSAVSTTLPRTSGTKNVSVQFLLPRSNDNDTPPKVAKHDVSGMPRAQPILNHSTTQLWLGLTFSSAATGWAVFRLAVRQVRRGSLIVAVVCAAKSAIVAGPVPDDIPGHD